MSYLVLARKYRPQIFSDLVGQEHVSQTLRNALKNERTAHAYLFTGPRGVGKTSAARLLAKALRCENRTSDNEPCNKCEACLEINEGRSIDVLEIDAASNTGVDNIREIKENVSYSATQGHYKVYIVDEVHMLSTAAFNALLKTLEEPPAHVVFIFATTEIHKVPATIQSRCQRFDFKKINQNDLKSSLRSLCEKESIEIDDASLQIIAIESEGCLRDAQSLLDQAIALCGEKISIENFESALGLVNRHHFFGLVRNITEHNGAEALPACCQLHDQGVDPRILLRRLTQFYRDLHYEKFTQSFESDDSEYKELLKESAQKLAEDEVVRGLDLCLNLQARLQSTMHVNFAIEGLVLKLCLQRPAGAGKTISSPSGSNHSRHSARQGQATPQNRELRKLSPSNGASKPNTSDQANSGSFEKYSQTQSAPSTAIPQRAESSSKPKGNQAAIPGVAALENYLHSKKPAWIPVLRSILKIEENDSTVSIVVRADFAGKRLASKDGQSLLKNVYSSKAIDVQLDSASADKVKPQQLREEKKKEAREHDAVKTAMDVFGATIQDTTVLEEKNRT